MGLFGKKNAQAGKPASLTRSDTNSNLSVHTTGSQQQPATPTIMSARSANGSMSQIPEVPIPKAPDPTVNPAGYLRSIHAVRERSRIVFEQAKRNQLKHFVVDMSKFSDTAAYVVSIIKR
ncbi:MAG: DUF1688 family protein, partial [Terriglobus roseus]|nr:DUF1688 family protein [Terriglobus roseus]